MCSSVAAPRQSRIVVFLNSLRRREFLVTLAVLISLLTIPLQPLFGALLSTDTVIISYSAGNSTAISQLSHNVSDSFSDLKPFVLAANLATIKTILKVGALPFISDDGHTVEEFTLPTAINGTGTRAVWPRRMAFLSRSSLLSSQTYRTLVDTELAGGRRQARWLQSGRGWRFTDIRSGWITGQGILVRWGDLWWMDWNTVDLRNWASIRKGSHGFPEPLTSLVLLICKGVPGLEITV
ncbi:hypothetical protein K466DRAFT_388001 [Polyporus arcularius HHB13444]|uniref:Uncharacterized protein n=1 Tax=Polyporus arcularius HHB13444 TaxID=1314778 RepID=A0A5C3PWB8_9APHY|nr:hypothetical protein K466DRAFT_388001 [Polyporus arcularius HHB13444]